MVAGRRRHVHVAAVGPERELLEAEHTAQELKKLVRPNRRLMPIKEDIREREGKDSDETAEEVVVKEGLSRGEEEMVREPEGEEGRVAKGVKAPQRVSTEEREEHERTHTPFRAWCRHCVRGRAKNMPHRTKQGKEEGDEAPRVSMDYFFMSEADETACENPLFVMIDEETGDKYARAVGQKGVGTEGEMDWFVKDVSAEMKAWGHSGGEGSTLILKSDGEAAIIAVREKIGKYHGGRVIPEDPAKGESPSNGRVEEAGKTVREFTRVLKDQIEEKAQMEIHTSDVIVLWMVRWAAIMCSRYLVGSDGRTAYERRKGRRCKLPVVPFGETVWYRKVRDNKERRNKFLSEWEEGLWLGHTKSSNEAVIGTNEGVVRAYAIRRKEEGQRWCAARIRNLQGTPQQPDPSKAGISIPVSVRFDPRGSDDEAIPTQPLRKEAGRRMRLTERLFDKYGHSEGCGGCQAQVAGMSDRKPHTEECRRRIGEAMEENAEGRDQKKKDEERMNRRIAEELEKNIKADEAEEAKDCSVSEVPFGDEDAIGCDELIAERIEKKREAEDAGPQPETKKQRAEDVEMPVGDPELESDIVMELRKISRGVVDIAEIYSPPRVTTEGKKHGLRIGEAMDLTTGWDFRRSEDRSRAMAYIDKYKPQLIIGSPMCTMFSSLQALSGWNEQKSKRWTEARRHIKFVVEVYRKQLSEGRLFLHEHPARAISWDLKEIRKLQREFGVIICEADQCMYGLKTWDSEGRLVPAKKRTKFMTNSEGIARRLQRRCPGKHRHQQLVSGRAQSAARYPENLCVGPFVKDSWKT